MSTFGPKSPGPALKVPVATVPVVAVPVVTAGGSAAPVVAGVAAGGGVGAVDPDAAAAASGVAAGGGMATAVAGVAAGGGVSATVAGVAAAVVAGGGVAAPAIFCRILAAGICAMVTLPFGRTTRIMTCPLPLTPPMIVTVCPAGSWRVSPAAFTETGWLSSYSG